MEVVLIAAVAANGVIGRGGKLPWRLPDDMAQFKQRTLGRPVIMGRKTWESLQKPLAGRLNVVVTRQRDYAPAGVEVARSYEEALALAERSGAGEAWVIGGSEVYARALETADRLVLTHVDAVVEGDAFFPDVDWSAWRIAEEESHPADDRHAHPFRVAVYERAR